MLGIVGLTVGRFVRQEAAYVRPPALRGELFIFSFIQSNTDYMITTDLPRLACKIVRGEGEDEADGLAMCFTVSLTVELPDDW